MEMKDLFQFVVLIVLVAIVIGAGVLSLNHMAWAVPKSTIVVNDTMTVVNNTNVKLDHGNLTSFSRIINASSTELTTAEYTVYYTNGSVTFNIVAGNSTCGWGKDCYADYVYNEHDTPASRVLVTGRTEVGNISTNWLGIIITIAMVAILIGLLVTSFMLRRR